MSQWVNHYCPRCPNEYQYGAKQTDANCDDCGIPLEESLPIPEGLARLAQIPFKDCPECKGTGRDIENTVDILDHLGEVLGMRHPECENCDGSGLA